MSDLLILLSLIILAICFMLRVPVGISMLGAAMIYLLLKGADIGLIVDVIMSKFYNNTVLVAVPLFIFAANIMNSGKITEYMFKFVKAIIGRKRGATAYINIIISLIFSGMSGAALADAAGIGVIELEEMKKDGYDMPFSAAITAATSVVGPIFPPSIPMVVYGMLAGVSVGQLFLGGVIPAFVICLFFGVYVWYISKKRNYPRGEKFTFKEFVRYSLKALPALLTPVILLGGIYSGVVTATEAGALAALYTIIIAAFGYKVLGLKKIMKAVKETVIQTGILMAIITGAYILSYVVTISGLGEMIANCFFSFTSSKFVFLLIVNVIFILVGMIVDTAILTWVLLPLVLPVATAVGVNMVQFGVVYVLNQMIGMVSPPYGVLCFITSGMAGESLHKVFREVMPMFIILIIVLLLITYIPDIVMFIPNMMTS